MLNVWILFLFVAVCLYTDLTERKIYNSVILSGIVAALVINIIQLNMIAGTLFTFAGLLIGILLLLIPFIMGGLGAGDVKMLGMIGAFTGHGIVVQILLASAVVGGIYALIVMLAGRKLLSRMWKIVQGLYLFAVTKKMVYCNNLQDKDAEKNAIPYGVALSAGVIIIYVLGSMNHALTGISFAGL
jgi:prepilin peptidase CpaA